MTHDITNNLNDTFIKLQNAYHDFKSMYCIESPCKFTPKMLFQSAFIDYLTLIDLKKDCDRWADKNQGFLLYQLDHDINIGGIEGGMPVIIGIKLKSWPLI